MIKKVLKKLKIIQEVPNKGRSPKLGRGYSTAIRINPYNPLSYITILITLIMGLIMFGFVGIQDQVDFRNPFKWD